MLFSETSGAVAAVFTRNYIKAAPVLLSQQRVAGGKAAAVVVNSGCANACTGEPGMAEAEEMAALAARRTGIAPENVLVASTGVIGQRLPMDRIKKAMSRITLSREGGHQLARAIMTTDTVPKEVAVRVDEQFVIGGIAKGSGMIHPDLATLLCFLTTDATVDVGFLNDALRRSVDVSFNMISIDGDTSPNDMVLFMANGMAGTEPVSAGSPSADKFQRALNQVCVYLARAIARDGEGATRLVEVSVTGARNQVEARVAARTVVNSTLVKAAIHGSDPNWGRVVAALGRCGVEVDETRIELYLGKVCLVRSGVALPVDRQVAVAAMSDSEVEITVNLNMGSASATAWGCDLSEEYVTINSQYTT